MVQASVSLSLSACVARHIGLFEQFQDDVLHTPTETDPQSASYTLINPLIPHSCGDAVDEANPRCLQQHHEMGVTRWVAGPDQLGGSKQIVMRDDPIIPIG